MQTDHSISQRKGNNRYRQSDLLQLTQFTTNLQELDALGQRGLTLFRIFQSHFSVCTDDCKPI